MYKGVAKNICINLNLSKFQDAGQLRRRLFLDTSHINVYHLQEFISLESTTVSPHSSPLKTLGARKVCPLTKTSY